MGTSPVRVERRRRSHQLWWLRLLGVAVIGQACYAPRVSSSSNRLDRTVITREQMLNGNYASIYDAVAAMRSMWLRPRGVDSFTNPSIVWVYVDGARVGDVSVLKEMQPRLVNTVRFYDGPQATSRWGVDNAAGVIHVSTWSDGAPGIPVPDSTRRLPDSTRRRPPSGFSRSSSDFLK